MDAMTALEILWNGLFRQILDEIAHFLQLLLFENECLKVIGKQQGTVRSQALHAQPYHRHMVTLNIEGTSKLF